MYPKGGKTKECFVQDRTNLALLVLILGVLSLLSLGIMALSVVRQLYPPALSAINKQLNYQGKLQDSSGITVPDGFYDMKFSIYDSDTGGSRLWTECGTTGTPTARQVEVKSGVFSVLFGDTAAGLVCDVGGTPAAPNVIDLKFDSDSYWLGVTIEGDAEMTPRKRIGASGYSFNADLLDGLNTSNAGGSDAFVPVTDSSGNLILSKNFTVDTTTLFVDSTDNEVGIGTASPLAKLHIYAPATVTTIYSEDFDSAGTWNNSGTTVPPYTWSTRSEVAAHSGSDYWAYNDGVTDNYDTGDFIMYYSYSDPIDLSAATAPVLDLKYMLDLEEVGVKDMAGIFVADAADPTGFPYSFWTLGENKLSWTDFSQTLDPAWGNVVVGVVIYASDGSNNSGFGFRIDTVNIDDTEEGDAGYFQGRVGINTLPSYALDVTSDKTRTINIENTNTSGYGGYFTTTGTNGYAVYGAATDTGGFSQNFGGYFTAAGGFGAMGVMGEASTSGTGVYGYSASGTGGSFLSNSGPMATGVNAAVGAAMGMVFDANRAIFANTVLNNGLINYGGDFSATFSTMNNYGISATASAGGLSSVQNWGGYFSATGDSSYGVQAVASESGATSGNYGGHFAASGGLGTGVYGEANYWGAVTNYGGRFIANGDMGVGVYGEAPASWMATNYGGYFTAAGENGGVGIYGRASGASGLNYGVYGETVSSSGWSGYFTGGQGVWTTGNLEVDKHAALATNASYNDNIVLNMDETYSGGPLTSEPNNYYGIYNKVTGQVDTGLCLHGSKWQPCYTTYYGQYNDLTSNGSYQIWDGASGPGLVGLYQNVTLGGSDLADVIRGADIRVNQNSSGFASTAATGLNVSVTEGFSGGTIGTSYGGNFNVYGGDWNYGVYAVATGDYFASFDSYGVYGSADGGTLINYGVYGTTSTSGGTGVYGQTSAASGYGVQGYASDTSGPNYGGRFQSDGPWGYGVYGWASGTDTTYGVYGIVSSSSGWGGYFQGGQGLWASAAVIGSPTGGYIADGYLNAQALCIDGDCKTSWPSGGSGTPGGNDTNVQFNDSGAFGGDGDFTWDKTNNYLYVANRIGIGTGAAPFYGLDVSTTTSYGASIVTSSVGGTGVYGLANDTSATANYGGYFTAAGASWSVGVTGIATDNSAVVNYGGQFSAYGDYGMGVYGAATESGSFTNYGGYFTAAGDWSYGVYGSSPYTGVSGTGSASGAVTNYGGYFTAAGDFGYGVYASSPYIGIYGATTSGTGWAGYFENGYGLYGSKIVGGAAANPGSYSLYITGTGYLSSSLTANSFIAGNTTFQDGSISTSGSGDITIDPAGVGNVFITNDNFNVDSNTLYVDAANNRVGVNGAPAYTFTVVSSGTRAASITNSAINAIGLYSESTNTGGYGVYGYSGGATGLSYGVYGNNASTGGVGVKGIASAATGTTYGIYGQATSASGWGGYFTGGQGLYADGTAHNINSSSGGTALTVSDSSTAADNIVLKINWADSYLTTTTGGPLKIVSSTNTNFTTTGDAATRRVGLIQVDANVTSASGGNFIAFNSDVDGTSDAEFRVSMAGATYADGAYSSAGADLAEVFDVSDLSLATGDLVVIDSITNTLKKSSAAYEEGLVGIITEESLAGFIGNSSDGEITASQRIVSLIGRMSQTKVSDENGAITVGDLLTSSSTPGVAMRATKPGPVIGRALAPWSGPGQGTIIVYVNPGWNTSGKIMTDGTASFFDDDFIFNKAGTADAITQGYNSYGLTLRGSGWDGAAAANRDMKLLNTVTDADNYKLSILNNAGTEVAYINQNGTMGVSGKFYPASPTGFQTDAYIFYQTNYMRTNADGWSTGSFDFAEMFISREALEAGDLVSVDGDTNEYVKKSTGAYDSMVLGIVSTKPGFLAGTNVDFDDPNPDQGYPIALAGRVPTKVSIENGPIIPGDPLAASSIPGVAMKATDPGMVVGVALEGWNNSEVGKIKVFVNLSWYGVNGDLTPISELSSLSLDGNLDMKGNYILNVGKIIGKDEIWSIDENGVLKVKMIEDGTEKEMFATASPKVEINLSGTANLENGVKVIDLSLLDEDFVKNISTDTALKIFVTASEECNGVYVSERAAASFTVKETQMGTSNAAFDWMVVARRKGYDDPPAETPPTPASPPAEEPAVPPEDPPVEEPAPEIPPVEESEPETPVEEPAPEPPPVP